jgi:glutamate racemase
MLAAGADTLVLGCTHYPFFDAAIRDITGEHVTVIDTSVAIAKQLERVLEANGLLAETNEPAPLPRLYSTDEGSHLHRLAATLLGLDAPVQQVVIDSRAHESGRSHAA